MTQDPTLDQLFALLYQELHRLAHRQRRHWRGDDTLNTTAMVHETWIKLNGAGRLGIESRTHFLALASRAMRQILCNYAREKGARKRGGGLEPVRLDDERVLADRSGFLPDQAETLAALDDALRKLEQIDARQSQVVECRFFGGLSVEDTAAAVGVSPRTVRRDWAVAQAWLHRELRLQT